MHPTVHRATLALLLEAGSTPTPGNVDRDRDLPDLRLDHFCAGALGAVPGLTLAASGAPIGHAFERSVAGMGAAQTGGNTQFGALLLAVPLVATAATGPLTAERAAGLVADTSTADTAAFYRSFEHVSVAVGPPPSGVSVPNVRAGEDAIPDLESAGHTLHDVMCASASVDDVAREWTEGFPRTFDAADRLIAASGPPLDRGARVHLRLLADRPDTFVAKRHGPETAESVRERAAALLSDPAQGAIDDFADDLVARGINPGTTADILAGGFVIALDRGLRV